MADQNGAKGNPASKRMMNPKHKAVRSLSWQRGEKRKRTREKEQDARSKANKAALEELVMEHHLRIRSDVRPSKALRLARRELDATVQAKARRAENEDLGARALASWSAVMDSVRAEVEGI